MIKLALGIPPKHPQFPLTSHILVGDLHKFMRLTETLPVTAIERLLDTLNALTHRAAHAFGGTIRFSIGDACCVTFREVFQVIAAAERLSQDWEAASREERSGCGINIALHRGKINAYRSFLYGEGLLVAARVVEASGEARTDDEGSVFVTSAVRDNLSGTPWHNRLQPIALNLRDARFAGLEVYRLGGASLWGRREQFSNNK